MKSAKPFWPDILNDILIKKKTKNSVFFSKFNLNIFNVTITILSHYLVTFSCCIICRKLSHMPYFDVSKIGQLKGQKICLQFIKIL
jgi:hypothetical protein